MAGKQELAHEEWFAEVPRSIVKHSLLGFALLCSCVGGFSAWAFTAPLAAAVIAQGSFVATGQNKIVQHLEGGIIKEILISEGDHVLVGQPIIQLDETAAAARERELSLRRARLEATNAKLMAEEQGKDRIEWPPYILERMADPEVASILRSQKLSFESTRRKIKSDVTMLGSNIEALRFRAHGYQQQHTSMNRQRELLLEEYKGKKTLFDKGLIRKPEIHKIERAIADAAGQIARLQAEVDETNAQSDRFIEQIAQTKSTYRQAAIDEMQTIQGELDAVREQWRSAANMLERATINAPVSGTVVRLHYHTPGGVIESGKAIAEIIPTDVPLIIEVQVPRSDIDSVRNGQMATVRLTALNQRTTPVLEGWVDYVSADALPDGIKASEAEVYVARVSLSAKELSRVPGFKPTPGMPAEIMIQTAQRTFFDYLSRPIRDSMIRAFREQ
ncbi:HlyD family type I secretion periplasmic adaptor subunit [Pseudahrensia aquimaris]|uniref:Membrane fusion protein (MFP) family protein n=1 Tax=Pseudahrensia aquimaris TaxID=744461 RepID=A0ABW3FFZ2_9HYPH